MAQRPKPAAKQASGAAERRPPGKNRLRQLRREWRKVFETIADTEAAVESLEARMAAPGFFGDREGSREVTATYEDLKSRLPSLYEELEKLDGAVGSHGVR